MSFEKEKHLFIRRKPPLSQSDLAKISTLEASGHEVTVRYLSDEDEKISGKITDYVIYDDGGADYEL